MRKYYFIYAKILASFSVVYAVTENISLPVNTPLRKFLVQE